MRLVLKTKSPHILLYVLEAQILSAICLKPLLKNHMEDLFLNCVRLIWYFGATLTLVCFNITRYTYEHSLLQ